MIRARLSLGIPVYNCFGDRDFAQWLQRVARARAQGRRSGIAARFAQSLAASDAAMRPADAQSGHR